MRAIQGKLSAYQHAEILCEAIKKDVDDIRERVERNLSFSPEEDESDSLSSRISQGEMLDLF